MRAGRVDTFHCGSTQANNACHADDQFFPTDHLHLRTYLMQEPYLGAHDVRQSVCQDRVPVISRFLNGEPSRFLFETSLSSVSISWLSFA